MTPPFVARAVLAAVTPPPDYESVAGDLHEEYMLRAESMGRVRANRWYWSQTLRSMPSLLSYSRARRSFASDTATTLIVVAVLFAMLLFKEPVDAMVHAIYRNAAHWVFFFADWIDAALFGAVLCAIVRSQGLRMTLIASLVLVGGFAIPIVAGVSPRLPGAAWLLLLGAIPAMSIGAASYQVMRRR